MAIWIATAIMTYNRYIESVQNNNLNIDNLYFLQSEISKQAIKICDKNINNGSFSTNFTKKGEINGTRPYKNI